ncbi:hypothetical protein M2325_000655 [Methanococcus voltae PS]|uniref:Uncharacterized protein n=1 Tax=Methanococcus voltae PS TaxID=523842 RepID=A0ABT2EYI0_METVO|nr:hypothetical protein [Methanococcus voltae]MCS3921970.1 hypothetical protein [Methanococcus voltae PS]
MELITEPSYEHKFFIDSSFKTGVKEDGVEFKDGKKYLVYKKVYKIDRVLKKGFNLEMLIGILSYNEETGKYEVDNKKELLEMEDLGEIWELYPII